ncbi:short-chain dehydrogenase [Mycobacterium sp. djl-10]|nr:short-chain dehydrogenase [Mycobacterium sp. djl-10]
MEVLVTGGDTELGRTIAEGFRNEGHRVVISGARRDELEVAAKELDIDAIVCDTTEPASLVEARSAFPQHLDSIVHVPTPRWQDGDPRTYSLSQQATAWHNALDTTVLSAALTLQTIGDHLRAGGSVVNVVPESPRDGSAEAAVKAALSAWTADQAAVYGTRGITINVVAAGRGSQPGYDGLSSTAPSTAAEITRLALFLSTAGARHVTGQTLHVSTGALAHFG